MAKRADLKFYGSGMDKKDTECGMTISRSYSVCGTISLSQSGLSPRLGEIGPTNGGAVIQDQWAGIIQSFSSRDGKSANFCRYPIFAFSRYPIFNIG